MWFKSFQVIILFCSVIYCTVDLNIHQLQFVADHLHDEECKKLAEALHETSFKLTKPVDGKHELNRTCIYLLLKWDRTEGNGKTFDDLVIRLEQIGRHDLADALSKMVYSENVDELERKFLSDPFKEKISKDHFLLGDPVKRDVKVKNVEDVGLSGLEITAIVLGAVCVTCVGFFLVYKLFGNEIRRAFRKYAPQFLVAWLDLVTSECKWCGRRLSKSYKQQVVGSKAGEQFDRQTIINMNRNLNNYLNGHYLDLP